MAVSKRQLQSLRNRLPRGYQAKVQARLKQGVSLEYIRLVAWGERNSSTVLNCLIDIAEEHQRAQSAIGSRLTSLANA